MLTLLAFVLVFLPVVLVHELGHFITAKLAGVKVLEFGIGYPPRLFAFKFRGTDYSLNLFPIGGFVKLLGEENPQETSGTPGERDAQDTSNLARRSIGIRSLVMGAGALMNVILPVVMFSITFLIPQSTIEGFVQVADVAPNSPAERAGIQPKDTILKVNGRDIKGTQELSYIIRLSLGSPVTMLIQRGERQLTAQAVPRWKPPPGEGSMGIQMKLIGAYPATRSYPIWEAVPLSVQRTWEILVMTKNEITRWIIGVASPQLAGPIGIYQITGEVAKAGVIPLMDFAALLSINLGILNILPIPMLDGGRLLFLAVEVVRRGKRISPERESLVHLVGFAVMIALMVVVSLFDIQRLLKGESLLR